MLRTPVLLILFVSILVAFGLVMLASASGVRGVELYGDPMFFVKRQILWLALALLAGVVAAHIDYRHWQTLAVPLLLLS
ncbi:MAG: FtsW/RodA/SpoVE family cell cycle protein, partial [Kiritimatiellia bacterium]